MSLGYIPQPNPLQRSVQAPVRTTTLEVMEATAALPPSVDGSYVAYFPRSRIFCLNVAMCVFHLTLMTTTLTLGKLDLKIPIYSTNLTFVENTSGDDGPRFQLIPEYVEYSHIYLTLLTASFFLCSALAHGGNATLWRSFYERELGLCRVTTRWIEYFFSASIMIFIIAFNAGIREYLLLLAITALIATTMCFGLLTEMYARPVSDTTWSQPFAQRFLFHGLGYIPQISAWVLILFNFYSDATQNPPDFVYIIVWTELGLFFSFGLVQLYQMLRGPKDYYKGEIMYQWLSVIAKGLLGMLLLSNVLILSSFDELYN